MLFALFISSISSCNAEVRCRNQNAESREESTEDVGTEVVRVPEEQEATFRAIDLRTAKSTLGLHCSPRRLWKVSGRFPRCCSCGARQRSRIVSVSNYYPAHSLCNVIHTWTLHVMKICLHTSTNFINFAGARVTSWTFGNPTGALSWGTMTLRRSNTTSASFPSSVKCLHQKTTTTRCAKWREMQCPLRTRCVRSPCRRPFRKSSATLWPPLTFRIGWRWLWRRLQSLEKLQSLERLQRQDLRQLSSDTFVSKIANCSFVEYFLKVIVI